MIPKFPQFKNLEILDKEEIEKITNLFSPYSDFNFVSLYSWDTQNLARISLLNGNLVVKFLDYITSEPFYTFIGRNEVPETIRTLLDISEKEGLTPRLKLVPEEIIQPNLSSLTNQFSISEDRDNFDYVLSIEGLSELKGGKYHDERNLVNRFKRENANCQVTSIDLSDARLSGGVLGVFEMWEKSKNAKRVDTENELIAVKRVLNNFDALNVLCLGVYIKDTMVAFSISEVERMGWATAHYRKADNFYRGIFQFLEQETNKKLLSLGCKNLNYEQDLGIEGLRKAKQLLRPVSYLKKYTIKPKL